MIFKVTNLLQLNKVDEAKDFISATLNKLLQEEKFSLVNLILSLFIKNQTLPDFIYCLLLELTSEYKDKLPNRNKIEEMLKVCE